MDKVLERLSMIKQCDKSVEPSTHVQLLDAHILQILVEEAPNLRKKVCRLTYLTKDTFDLILNKALHTWRRKLKLELMRTVLCAMHQQTNPEFRYHGTPNNTRKRRVRLHQQRAAEMRNYYRLATIVKEACKYELNSYIEQVATQLANTAQNGITKPTYNKIKFFRTRRAKPVQMVRDKQGNVPQDKTEEAGNTIGHFATTMKAAPATMKQHVLTDRTMAEPSATNAPQSNCPRIQLSGYLTPRRPLQRQRTAKH